MAVQLPETMEGQDAVFAGDGYDIRCYAQGQQVEQGLELREGDAVARCKGLQEFKSYSAARKVLERIPEIVTFVVEYGYLVGKLLVGGIMFEDY